MLKDVEGVSYVPEAIPRVLLYMLEAAEGVRYRLEAMEGVRYVREPLDVELLNC